MKKLEEEKGLPDAANTAPNSVRARSTKLRSVKAVEESRERKAGPISGSVIKSVSAIKLPAIKNKTHRRYESAAGLPGLGLDGGGTEYGA